MNTLCYFGDDKRFENNIQRTSNQIQIETKNTLQNQTDFHARKGDKKWFACYLITFYAFKFDTFLLQSSKISSVHRIVTYTLCENISRYPSVISFPRKLAICFVVSLSHFKYGYIFKWSEVMETEFNNLICMTLCSYSSCSQKNKIM